MPRKSFTLFFVLLFFTCTVTSASGANFNAMATKYVMAAQKKDIKALLDMHASVQAEVAKIKKNTPKILRDDEIKKAYDWEEKYVNSDNKLNLFTPDMKWKLLESHKNTIYPKHWGTFYSLFIGVAYDDPNTAPISNGKPMKRSIFVIDFSTNGQYYNKLMILEDKTSYWPLPLKISGLKHEYNDNTLIISFNINGGKPDTLGGNPPYENIVAIKDLAARNEQKITLIENYFNKEKYSIDYNLLLGGTTIAMGDTTVIIRYKKGWYEHVFKWPPETIFPVMIGVSVSDSSAPQQLTDAATDLIKDGQIE